MILISLVRANGEGQIGFLRDLRRMNVAMTRARMKLIILGDTSTMARHPFYNKLYRHIMNTGRAYGGAGVITVGGDSHNDGGADTTDNGTDETETT